MPWELTAPDPQIDQTVQVGVQRLRVRMLIEPVPEPPKPNVVNARDRGVKGDGTADDAPAIQKALDGLPPGHALYFPAGSYLLGAPMTLAGERIGILGDGEGSTLIHGGHGGLIVKGRGVTVRGVRLTGLPGKYYADKNTAHGILIDGATGVRIEDTRLNGPGNGIYMVNGAQDLTVQGCLIAGWGSVGLGIGGKCLVKDTALVQDDPARDQQRSNHGVYVFSGATDVRLEGVLIQNCRKTAVHIYGETEQKTIGPVTLQGVRMIDCRMGVLTANFPATASRVKRLVVNECQAAGTYDGPAFMFRQGDGVEVTGNLATGGGIGFAFGHWATWETNSGLLTGLRAANNVCRNCQIGFYPLASNGGRFQDCALGPNNQAYDTPRPLIHEPTPGLTVIS